MHEVSIMPAGLEVTLAVVRHRCLLFVMHRDWSE